jgi:hypothetical protein
VDRCVHVLGSNEPIPADTRNGPNLERTCEIHLIHHHLEQTTI